MEYCTSIDIFNECIFDELKNKLRKLHCFNVVHLDIKPENIGFSPSLQEPVFIDFGLSKTIK